MLYDQTPQKSNPRKSKGKKMIDEATDVLISAAYASVARARLEKAKDILANTIRKDLEKNRE